MNLQAKPVVIQNGREKERTCSCCGSSFDTSPFANMDASGVHTYSDVVIYGQQYDLCPSCTSHLHKSFFGGKSK